MQMDLMAMDKGKGKPVFLQALTRDKVRLYNWGGGRGLWKAVRKILGVWEFWHFSILFFLGGIISQDD